MPRISPPPKAHFKAGVEAIRTAQARRHKKVSEGINRYKQQFAAGAKAIKSLVGDKDTAGSIAGTKTLQKAHKKYLGPDPAQIESSISRKRRKTLFNRPV